MIDPIEKLLLRFLGPKLPLIQQGFLYNQVWYKNKKWQKFDRIIPTDVRSKIKKPYPKLNKAFSERVCVIFLF